MEVYLEDGSISVISSPCTEAADGQRAPDEAVVSGTYTCDSGTPTEVFNQIIEANHNIVKAMGVIRLGPEPEDKINPDKLLDDALKILEKIAKDHPLSRMAWSSIGDAYWFKYEGFNQRSDLENALEAYVVTINLMIDT